MGSASEDEEEEEEEGDGGKWWMRNVSISRVLSIQSTKEMKEGGARMSMIWKID